MTNNIENILSKTGLTPEQSKIYFFLVENGITNAKVISMRTKVGRTLTYKVLDQLIDKELVEKRDRVGKVSIFAPLHPQKIKDELNNSINQSKIAADNFSSVFNGLVSQYNTLLGKPNVKYLEGISGIEEVYNDILDTGQDISVISSSIEENRKDVLSIIREQIKKQIEKGIKVKAITQMVDHEIATPVEEDKINLIVRKQISADKLNIPAQIIIWGDKVAITNFKEQIITVVIDSKYIKETFVTIFNFIWSRF
jgi:sugar-specific transcriptional regulator TrmB